MDVDQACREAGIARHVVRFSSTIIVDDPGPPSKTAEKIYQKIKGYKNHLQWR
jgi:integrator complex subunit 11